MMASHIEAWKIARISKAIFSNKIFGVSLFFQTSLQFVINVPIEKKVSIGADSGL